MDQPKRRWTPDWHARAKIAAEACARDVFKAATLAGRTGGASEETFLSVMMPIVGSHIETALKMSYAPELVDLVERLSQANLAPSTEDQRSMTLGFLAEEARELLKRIRGA